MSVVVDFPKAKTRPPRPELVMPVRPSEDELSPEIMAMRQHWRDRWAVTAYCEDIMKEIRPRLQKIRDAGGLDSVLTLLHQLADEQRNQGKPQS